MRQTARYHSNIQCCHFVFWKVTNENVFIKSNGAGERTVVLNSYFVTLNKVEINFPLDFSM